MVRDEINEKLNKGGIGLGLAISQNLVEILNDHEKGGEIAVESEYGKGSVFSFSIRPLNAPKTCAKDMKVRSRPEEPENYLQFDKESVNFLEDEDHGSRESIQYKKPNSNFKIFHLETWKKKILLVDDDQINILVLRKIFDHFRDCQYLIACNGAEAVAIVNKMAKENYFFDIIFMDVNMPIMDGFEATKRILKMTAEKEIPGIHIIASTANSSVTDYENCYRCGMVDFISKPFTKKQIREKLDLFDEVIKNKF